MGAPPRVERDPQSSLLDAPEPGRREPVHTGENGGFQDQVVYKYSLESMASRGEFLKAAVKKRSEADLANFAERVSQCTGCKHNGWVIQFKPCLYQRDFWPVLGTGKKSRFWKVAKRSGARRTWPVL